MNAGVSRRELLVSALAAGSAACNRGGRKTIAVIPMGRSHVFWQSVHAGAIKAARENGIDVEWNGPAAETDKTGQLQIFEAMINKQVDAIALAPIDHAALVAVVERAARQGIPVIIFDSPVDTDVFVARITTDNLQRRRACSATHRPHYRSCREGCGGCCTGRLGVEHSARTGL